METTSSLHQDPGPPGFSPPSGSNFDLLSQHPCEESRFLSPGSGDGTKTYRQGSR